MQPPVIEDIPGEPGKKHSVGTARIEQVTEAFAADGCGGDANRSTQSKMRVELGNGHTYLCTLGCHDPLRLADVRAPANKVLGHAHSNQRRRGGNRRRFDQELINILR